jgi:hypothetical protein
MVSPKPKIQSLLKNILLSRKDITFLACQQRAKFEGWLKFELASALYRSSGIEKIIIEDSYPTNGRSDISFEFDGTKWFIEMKTANTNWRAENLENLSRPVTRNMDGIVEDIIVLRDKSAPAHGLAVFCIFPIPDRLWKNTREQLNYHLRRIEEAGKLIENTLVDNAEFVAITDNFGICTFVVEVA